MACFLLKNDVILNKFWLKKSDFLAIGNLILDAF